MGNGAKKFREDENYQPQAVPAPLQMIYGSLQGTSAETEQTVEGTRAGAALFVPDVKFDGGTIEALLAEHDEAVDWLRRHMGMNVQMQENWTPGPEAAIGKMTHMGWGVWIESGTTAEGTPFPKAERRAKDSNIRWYWGVRDLQEKREQLRLAGVRVSEPYTDPEGRQAFDFWALAGEERLTAVQNPNVQDDGFADENVFRLTVKNLQSAVAWYMKHIGMKLEADCSDEGYCVLTFGIHYSDEGRARWIVDENPDAGDNEASESLFRLRTSIPRREHFFAYHRSLQESGANVSPVGGFIARGRVYFHVYDPEGNRFDFSAF